MKYFSFMADHSFGLRRHHSRAFRKTVLLGSSWLKGTLCCSPFLWRAFPLPARASPPALFPVLGPYPKKIDFQPLPDDRAHDAADEFVFVVNERNDEIRLFSDFKVASIVRLQFFLRMCKMSFSVGEKSLICFI